MPYFPKIKVLFIHIPKTGGSSVEIYFKNKFNVNLFKENLFSVHEKFNNHSYQHLTYNEIYDNRISFKINFKKLFLLFAVVRNPYERLISELFFRNLINTNMNANEVEGILIKYIRSNDDYDNHKTPQYIFLLDSDGNINPNIKILRTETLDEDMKNIGYDDFNINTQCTYRNKVDYYKLLSPKSIRVINKFYEKDFELLSYNKIQEI